jgi:hypothetical protein
MAFPGLPVGALGVDLATANLVLPHAHLLEAAGSLRDHRCQPNRKLHQTLTRSDSKGISVGEHCVIGTDFQACRALWTQCNPQAGVILLRGKGVEMQALFAPFSPRISPRRPHESSQS